MALALVWACLLIGAAAASALEVRVRPNGATLTHVATTFVVDSFPGLVEKVANAFHNYRLGSAWWLADLDGGNVTTWEQVVASQKRLLSVVPTDKLFQWSPRRIGERFPVQVDEWEGVELETIASTPRMFLAHNLFSEEETIFLINSAMSQTGERALQVSSVGFSTTGEREEVNTRTSTSAWDGESPTARKLIKRCFDVLRIPFQAPMADGLQILRYQEGQAYETHIDWFEASREYNFDSASADGANRFATVFLYLWPPPSGGYTVFPKAALEDPLRDSAFVSTGRNRTEREQAMLQASKFYDKEAWELNFTEECYSKLAVKPMRFGASLFYHQEPMSGRLLDAAEHGACPSLTGTKWGANLWVWNKARHTKAPNRDTPSRPETPPLVDHMEAVFENREEQASRLEYSVDDAGTWTFFQDIPALSQISVRTFPGHLWRFVTAADGRELARWVALEGVKAAFVRSDGQHGKHRTEV